MKIAVIGSRNFQNLNKVTERVHEFCRTEYGKVTIVSGGAIGVDQKAVWAAENFGLEHKEITPKYDLYGDDAPHKRNDEIIVEADKVIAFWTGERAHSGTWSVISKCLQRGKDIEVIFDQH